MAKTKEQEVAKKYYVELLKPQNEIAFELGLTEKTVGVWVNKGKWKEERDARINNTENRAEKIKEVIGALTESALSVMDEIKLARASGDKSAELILKKESTRISQEVGMYQKALEKLEKNFKVSLSTYLEVMEQLFQDMQNFDKDLYLRSLDFQKYHLQNVAQKLG